MRYKFKASAETLCYSIEVSETTSCVVVVHCDMRGTSFHQQRPYRRLDMQQATYMGTFQAKPSEQWGTVITSTRTKEKKTNHFAAQSRASIACRRETLPFAKGSSFWRGAHRIRLARVRVRKERRILEIWTPLVLSLSFESFASQLYLCRALSMLL